MWVKAHIKTVHKLTRLGLWPHDIPFSTYALTE
jgi:hypothetical protein